MSLILHIETSTKVCSVALSQSGKLVDYVTEKHDSFAHSELLTVLINSLLAKNGMAYNDLLAVSVSSGPGSYTGLRIGVSTAKGLCYALDIPLLSIDSLSALHYFAKSELRTQGIHLTMIDARRMEAFAAFYDAQDYCIKPVSADILDELYLDAFSSGCQITIVGDAQEKCKVLWANKANVSFSDLEADARGQIAPAILKFKNQDFEDLVYFEPKYFKDFQAGVKTK
jgi:tRNA threonylcarbamoyladenosine biosynthesis protein TsaB